MRYPAIWERTYHHPLVNAGGHATFKPEPIYAFIDAFVIGEGEEVIHEIVGVYQDWKASSYNRQELLHGLARIEGVYVPSLYEVNNHPDGTFGGIQPLWESAPLPVVKRIVAQLPPPTTGMVVPYIDTIHNRVPIEIMRLHRGCRFARRA
jgi:radical SAM superfamily enzyme YgiQ (UPF0313 family)